MKKIYFGLMITLLILFVSSNLSYVQSKKISELDQLKLRLEKPSEEDIRFVQELLRSFLGKKDLKITGKLDNQTINALKEFQKKFNLPQTGKLDPKTIENIFNIIFVSQPKSLTEKAQTETEEVQTGTKTESEDETIKAYYNYSIKIISPQENEILYTGKIYSIKWEFKPLSETSTELTPQLYLYLISDKGYERNIGVVPIFKTSFNWFIHEDLPPGEYRIRISPYPYYRIFDKYYDLDLKNNKPYNGENNYRDYYDSPEFRIISKQEILSEGKGIILEELPGSPEVSCQLPEMKRGDQMNEVYFLQLVLAIENYYPERIYNGFFGKLTEKAVKRLQKFYNLETNGIVSGKTLEIIQNLVNKNYEECAEDEKIEWYKFKLNLKDINYKRLDEKWHSYESFLSTYLYCDNRLRDREVFKFSFSSLIDKVFEIFIPSDCKNPLIGFSVPHFLSKIKSPIVNNFQKYEIISLINGDTNNDDIIDYSDNLNVSGYFKKDILRKNGDRYDLNLDGKVNDQDLQIVLRNFGKKGDLYKGIPIPPTNQIILNSIEPKKIYYGDKMIIRGSGFKSAEKLVIGIREISTNNISGYLTKFKVLDDETIEISFFPSQTDMCHSFNPNEPTCEALMFISPSNYSLIVLTDDNRKSNEIEIRVLGEKISD